MTELRDILHPGATHNSASRSMTLKFICGSYLFAQLHEIDFDLLGVNHASRSSLLFTYTTFSDPTIFYLSIAPVIVRAQGTAADYQRAQSLRDKFQGLAVNVPGNPTWIEGDNHFW